jgi:hypothetical protein
MGIGRVWMFERLMAGVLSPFQSGRRRVSSREEREGLFAEALAAYERGELTLTQARIAAGLASRPALLAYRFPRLFGHLSAFSAADRIRPVYAPEGGWRLVGDRANGRPSTATLPPMPPRPRNVEAPEPQPPGAPSPPPTIRLHAPWLTGGAQHSKPGLRLRGPWMWSTGSLAILLALVIAGGLTYLRIDPSPGNRSAPYSATRQPGVPSSPSVVGRLAVSSQLAFSCTLPVTAYAQRVRIGLPGGSVNLYGPQSVERNGPSASTYFNGRWLPVPMSWVSPDGSSYASTAAVPNSSDRQQVLLTRIQSGTSQVLWSGAGRPAILGWAVGGLYFLLQGQASAVSGDLWVVDPSRPGAATRVGPGSQTREAGHAVVAFTRETRIGGGAAWDVAHDPASNQDRVLRMDLGGGSVSPWYAGPANTPIFILGFDPDGHPVLGLYNSDTSWTRSLQLLTGPNLATSISNSLGTTHFASAFADSHGIWLGSPGSLWLYASGSLFKVADLPVGAVGAQSPMRIENATTPGNLPPPVVAGPCS